MNGSRQIVLLLVSSVLLVLPLKVWTQSAQPPRTAVPGFYNDLNKELVAVRRGEATFYQRCSFCHLPRIWKPGTTPGPAPSLSGILKDADKEKEDAVREQIKLGSLKMPGWQYSLMPAAIDDLMAYLKTL